MAGGYFSGSGSPSKSVPDLQKWSWTVTSKTFGCCMKNAVWRPQRPTPSGARIPWDLCNKKLDGSCSNNNLIGFLWISAIYRHFGVSPTFVSSFFLRSQPFFSKCHEPLNIAKELDHLWGWGARFNPVLCWFGAFGIIWLEWRCRNLWWYWTLKKSCRKGVDGEDQGVQYELIRRAGLAIALPKITVWHEGSYMFFKSLQRHHAELNMGHHKAFQCEKDIQIIQIVFNGLLNPSWLQPFNMYTLYFVLGWGMAHGGHKARLFGRAGTLTLRRAMWCPSRRFTRRVLWSCGASTNTSL